MKPLAKIIEYFARRRRIRQITRVAHEHSSRAFPQDRPAWSMLAEERSDECVVYVIYQSGDADVPARPHRFFRVKLPELSVNMLAETYYPEHWGPYL